MLTPSGPPAALPPPRRRIGRRLNSVPGWIFIGIVCVVFGAVCYTLYERNQDMIRKWRGMEASPSRADASKVLEGQPDGYIPAEKKEVAGYQFSPAPVANQSAPATRAEKAPEPNDNGREAARNDAWKQYWEERKELHKERYKNRRDALLALNTAVEATAHGHGAQPAETAAATPVSSSPVSQSSWGGGGYGGSGSPWLSGGGYGGFPGLATPQIDREGQEQKIGFAAQKGDLGKDDVVPTVRKPPDPLAVMAGSFVKFSTVNEVNSDVPGSTIGRVTESVYNNDGTCVLIPQGSVLLGHYNSVVSAGQDRLPGVLTRINFPDGSWQSIGAMEMADNAGSAGMEDQLNRHLLEKFSGALVAAAIGAGVQLSVPHNAINGYDSTQVAVAGAAQQVGQLGQQIALQNLSIPNTVKIRQGYNGTMIPDKNIHISPPWSCHGQRRASILPIMQIGGQ